MVLLNSFVEAFGLPVLILRFLGSLFLLSLPFLIIVWLFLDLKGLGKEKRDYRDSEYFLSTHIPFRKMRQDKGRYGEYLIYKTIKGHNESEKFLFNTYLPKESSGTSEVDIISISHYGVFVFESKNYGGKITGSVNDKNWTQEFCYRSKRGKKKHIEKFYNPIWQNNSHIKCLRKIIGYEVPVYSIIAFSDKCNININSKKENVFVVHYSEIPSVIASIESSRGARLSQKDIEVLYLRLYPYTQVSEKVKKQHIKEVNRYK